MSGFKIRIVHFGTCLHEKGVQKQKVISPLVNSREQKVFLVPHFNRSSTARCVSPSVYIGFRLFGLQEGRSRDVSSMPLGVRGSLVSWALCSVGVPSCAAPRHPALRPNLTRPWYVWVLDSTNCFPCVCVILKFVLDGFA